MNVPSRLVVFPNENHWPPVPMPPEFAVSSSAAETKALGQPDELFDERLEGLL
jgi:hypothetical protein